MKDPKYTVDHAEKISQMNERFYVSVWCNQQGSNLRPPPSQGGALIQLSYGCENIWRHQSDLNR